MPKKSVFEILKISKDEALALITKAHSACLDALCSMEAVEQPPEIWIEPLDLPRLELGLTYKPPTGPIVPLCGSWIPDSAFHSFSPAQILGATRKIEAEARAYVAQSRQWIMERQIAVDAYLVREGSALSWLVGLDRSNEVLANWRESKLAN